MAANRDRRSNAGTRMSRLIDAEEEEDFYKSTYGGFDEADDDVDFEEEEEEKVKAVKKGVVESDSADSDISMDEDDEVHSNSEDDKPKRKKKKGVSTKAYKEPRKDQDGPKRVREKKPHKPRSEFTPVIIGERRVRESTLEKTKERAAVREKEGKVKEEARREAEDRKKALGELHKRLTQQELMEEAKRTEKVNLKSLEHYHQLELERKRPRISKQVYTGPTIRYRSLTMPVVQEPLTVEEPAEINVTEESDFKPPENVQPVQAAPKPGEKCSRTLFSFTDDNEAFRAWFPKYSRPVRPVQLYCPVTKRPARYIDPITQMPYRTTEVFKYFRNAVDQQLDEETKLYEREQEVHNPTAGIEVKTEPSVGGSVDVKVEPKVNVVVKTESL